VEETSEGLSIIAILMQQEFERASLSLSLSLSLLIRSEGVRCAGERYLSDFRIFADYNPQMAYTFHTNPA